jgi:hypothetical protein
MVFFFCLDKCQDISWLQQVNLSACVLLGYVTAQNEMMLWCILTWTLLQWDAIVSCDLFISSNSHVIMHGAEVHSSFGLCNVGWFGAVLIIGRCIETSGHGELPDREENALDWLLTMVWLLGNAGMFGTFVISMVHHWRTAWGITMARPQLLWSCVCRQVLKCQSNTNLACDLMWSFQI